jgi:hypothetical protein
VRRDAKRQHQRNDKKCIKILLFHLLLYC